MTRYEDRPPEGMMPCPDCGAMVPWSWAVRLVPREGADGKIRHEQVGPRHPGPGVHAGELEMHLPTCVYRREDWWNTEDDETT